MPVYPLVAEPSLWRRVPWLKSMRVVAIADRDLPEPSSHEIDQKLAAFAEEIDDALSASGTTDETASDNASAPSERDAGPALSPEERRARIRYLLQQAPGDSFDGLPEGLLDTLTDKGQLPLLEEKLTPEAPYVEAANAIKAIGQLADWEWDHRSVKSAGSIAKLTEFYEQTDDRSLRGLIIDALFKFEAPEIPFEFILDRLAKDHVQLKAAILAPLQFYVNKPYIADLVNARLLPLLHEFCTYPLRDSIYSDEWHTEEDFRFWVFRCLGGIGNADSAPIIEEYLETHNWPLGTLAEAANAYWDITGSPRYIGILRRAETEGQLGNTEHALREMEKHLQEHGVDPEGE